MEIRQSRDRLFSTMEIPMQVRWHLYDKTAPRGPHIRRIFMMGISKPGKSFDIGTSQISP